VSVDENTKYDSQVALLKIMKQFSYEKLTMILRRAFVVPGYRCMTDGYQ